VFDYRINYSSYKNSKFYSSESARSYSSASYVNQIMLLYTFTFIELNNSMSNIEYDLVYIISRGRDLVCLYGVVTLTLHSSASRQLLT
jgi:hypothetical protein